MTISREKILLEISRHESYEGPSQDNEILKWFLGYCKSAKQWAAFVNVYWRKTGTMSYEAERQWIPTEELRLLATSAPPKIIDMSSHPLIDLLPTVRLMCEKFKAELRIERSFGQITSIEIETSTGQLINIELDDDIPKHRSMNFGGMWIETDAESLADELMIEKE